VFDAHIKMPNQIAVVRDPVTVGARGKPRRFYSRRQAVGGHILALTPD
jgi:hypothetical protein